MMVCTNACSKENKNLSLIQESAIIPIEYDIGKLRSLFAYFQYRAPNIDSIHSPLLSVEKHDQVLEKIIQTHNRKKGEYKFYSHNSNSENILKEQGLWGDYICSNCKRFACKRMSNKAKRDLSRRETDLECLLRHMRNSLAHGHVFIHHGGAYITICFEDENSNKSKTARIVCCQSDLIKWKTILETAVEADKANV